jgi:threonine dehydratase
MIPKAWLLEANHRIHPHIYRTPLHYDPVHDIYLKWENHQVTGSFKARGALNKVLSLEAWEIDRGLVAASAGNHGQGLALAGKLLNAKVTVFASASASPIKLKAMRAQGAEIILVPGGYGEAEQAGLAFANENGATWISPYNDGQIIAGQGTLGIEILQETESSTKPMTWIVPVGGGGLIAGVAAAAKELSSKGSSPQLNDTAPPLIIGVQSEASPFFHEIFHTGSQADAIERASLADGLAGPVEDGSITIPLVQHYVDDFLLVTEGEIEYAIAYAKYHYDEIIEGSAATALAAVLFNRVKTRPAVVILSGGNIQPELHQSICLRFNQEEME